MRRFAKAGHDMERTLAGAAARLDCALGMARSRCEGVPFSAVSPELAVAVRGLSSAWAAFDRETERVADALEEADRRRDTEAILAAGGWHVHIVPVGGGITSAGQAKQVFDDVMRQAYREGAQVGDGSTAAALEWEVANSTRIGTPTGHYVKATEQLNRMRKLDGNPHLSEQDAARLAEEMAKLERALDAAHEATGARGQAVKNIMEEWPEVAPSGAGASSGIAGLGATLRAAGDLLLSPYLLLLPSTELPRRRDVAPLA